MNLIIKISLILIVIIVISLIIIAATNSYVKVFAFFNRGHIRELKEFSDIKIEEEKNGNETTLIVSGTKIPIDSALTVYKTKTKQIGNETNVLVLVNLTGSEKGHPSKFETRINVDDTLTKITFGKERNVIWESKGS